MKMNGNDINSNNINANENVVVSVSNLTKEYLTGKACEGVSFELLEGHIYGLVGPNGAGKTTIMKMLGGLAVPTEGSIHMYRDGKELDFGEARAQMSFMIEQPYLRLDKTAQFNLEKQRILKGIEEKNVCEEVLKQVGLGDVPKKKKVKQYSLGMKQRLGIANALLSSPYCMVLDEPVNGLDPKGIVEIRELLQKYNKENHTTILISSHILGELSQLCTDYIFINHGKIVDMVSADELMNACSGDLYISTDDNQKALAIIEKFLVEKCQDIENLQDEEKCQDKEMRAFAEGDKIVVRNAVDELAVISRKISDEGLTILHLSHSVQSLENYYLENVCDDQGER